MTLTAKSISTKALRLIATMDPWTEYMKDFNKFMVTWSEYPEGKKQCDFKARTTFWVTVEWLWIWSEAFGGSSQGLQVRWHWSISRDLFGGQSVFTSDSQETSSQIERRLPKSCDRDCWVLWEYKRDNDFTRTCFCCCPEAISGQPCEPF